MKIYRKLLKTRQIVTFTSRNAVNLFAYELDAWSQD